MPPTQFLAGMRQVAGAVTIITTRDNDDQRRGLTATAVCSLSTEPPSLIACLNRKTWVAQFVPSSGVFAINVLSHAQEDVARAFAGQTSLTAGDRFMVGEWATGITGAPTIRNALVCFECRLQQLVEYSTHIILIGHVAQTILGNGNPLVYFDGSFLSVPRSFSAGPLEGEHGKCARLPPAHLDPR